MKKIFTLTIAALFLFTSAKVGAQSFHVYDTARCSTTGTATIIDTIYNTGTGSVTLDWKVVASDFPSDWIPNFSLCDNHTCYSNSGSALWPGVSPETSNPYTSGVGDFHMLLDLSSATSTGQHYLTVR